MNIVSIIKLVLSLASSLAQYAHDKKLMDAGAAQSVLEGLKNANEAIYRANAARADAAKLPDNPEDYR